MAMQNKKVREKVGYVLVRVPYKLHKEFKLLSIDEGESMQKILLRCIERLVTE